MNNKNIKYFILIILSFILLPINVFANEEITIETDKTDLEVGDEIAITAKVSSNKKIYALIATLNYDSNVFEKIENDSFVMPDESLDIVYNPKNNQIGIINKSGDLSNEIFTVHLKVKKEATVGNTNIALTNIISSDGQNKTIYKQNSIQVLVTRDAKEGEVIQSNKPNKINEGSEKVINVFSNKFLIIFLIIFITLLIIYIIYLVLKRKDRKILIISLIGLYIICGIVLISLLINNYKKSDINKDGEINYEDAKEIIKYLIDIKNTKKDNYKNGSNYDINNDGKLDITDAGISTKQTTQKTKYKVILAEKDKKEVYVNKGKITLNFNAIISPNEIIKQVEIDGKYYPVIKNSSFYSVTLNTPPTAGVHEFKISKVMLDNKREIDTSLSIKKEILKEKPYVDLFNVDDNTISFKLEDSDKAFINGKIIIIDENSKEIINEEIQEENIIKHNLKKDTNYKITVIASYDLDSNELNNITEKQDNLYSDEVIYSHQLLVTNNYDFKITDVTIPDTIEKNENIRITFKSTNSKNYRVEYIVINGKQFNATLIDKDKYEVILENFDTSTLGKNHIEIEKIALSNLKVFEKTKDYETNTLTYNVLKRTPVIDNIKLKNVSENISVSYKLNDYDETLQKLTAILIDSTDKVISSKEIAINDLNKDISLSYKGHNAEKYMVKFLADYNLGAEDQIYTNKNIGDEEIIIEPEISIVGISVVDNNIFPQKGQSKYTIKYTISVPNALKEKYKEFVGVTINGLNYNGIAEGLTKTTISLTIPSESGIIDLKIDRVKLSSENYQGNTQAFFSVQPHILQVDVLKDTPTIKNLEIVEEDYNNGSVTFKFDVVGDKIGFNSGTIELDEQTYSITTGKNEIKFTDIEKEKTFNLNFRGNYELDTNKLDLEDNKNSYKNELFYSVPYGLYSDDEYKDIALSNINFISNNNNASFEKEENIKFNFNITGMPSNLNLMVEKIIIKGNEYLVKKINDSYQVVLESYNSLELKELEVTDIILNNGKNVKLNNPILIKLEIVKDIVTILILNME